VTHVISCDAGRGPLASRTRRFLISRNARAFEIVHAQAQNHGRGRLHEWGASGALRGFVMAYLGQRDSRLPIPVADLVPAKAVVGYPTNFAAMPKADFKALTTRGEQLLRVLSCPTTVPICLGSGTSEVYATIPVLPERRPSGCRKMPMPSVAIVSVRGWTGSIPRWRMASNHRGVPLARPREYRGRPPDLRSSCVQLLRPCLP